MKDQILIIEDNPSRFFVYKQILEAKLKFPVIIQGIESNEELLTTVNHFKSSHIFCNRNSGAQDLIDFLSKKKAHRITTEITLLVVSELDSAMYRAILNYQDGEKTVGKATFKFQNAA